MSQEAILPDGAGEVIELFGTEALIRKRMHLHNKLAQKSILLTIANREYNDCILEIIQTNAALASEGVDTDALAQRLQSNWGTDSSVGKSDY